MPAIARRLPLSSAVSLTSVRSQFHRVHAIIVELQARARERRSLAQLDDRLLADIGLTREQQVEECSKSFWSLLMERSFR